MAQFEAVIEESSEIAAYLPHAEQLKEAVRKATEWNGKVEAIQVRLCCYLYGETVTIYICLYLYMCWSFLRQLICTGATA